MSKTASWDGVLMNCWTLPEALEWLSSKGHTEWLWAVHSSMLWSPWSINDAASKSQNKWWGIIWCRWFIWRWFILVQYVQSLRLIWGTGMGHCYDEGQKDAWVEGSRKWRRKLEVLEDQPPTNVCHGTVNLIIIQRQKNGFCLGWLQGFLIH